MKNYKLYLGLMLVQILIEFLNLLLTMIDPIKKYQDRIIVSIFKYLLHS